MLSKKEKDVIVNDFKIGAEDTGSAKVQVALLSKNIVKLTEHFKINPKDFGSKRGLMLMIGKRRRLLKYLLKNDIAEYEDVIKKLKIKKIG